MPATTEGPFAGCVGTAELLIAFSARYGVGAVPDLIMQMDTDKLTLRRAVAELMKGGKAFVELVSVVRSMIKVIKRREPEYVTARKRREEQKPSLFCLGASKGVQAR
jgi:hypothetical protein